MSNYNSLKATINANIKTNGNQEITGSVLNSVLNAMVNSLGAGYLYLGVADPSTSPGSPDTKVFYVASSPGTYTSFGGVELGDGEVAILKWDTTWSKDDLGIASQDEIARIDKFLNVVLGKFVPTWFDVATSMSDTIPKADGTYVTGAGARYVSDSYTITDDSLVYYADFFLLSDNIDWRGACSVQYFGSGNTFLGSEYPADTTSRPASDRIYLRQKLNVPVGTRKIVLFKNTFYLQETALCSTDDEVAGLKESDARFPAILPVGGYDFAIVDSQFKAIVSFKNGHIETKHFNSANLPDTTAIASVMNRYIGKRISILGDSISTFGDPSSTNQNGTYCYSYYPDASCRYSLDGNDSIQFNVQDTYWMKLIDRTGMILGVNDSYRGTMVSGTNHAFNLQSRINHLGGNGIPDVILVFGGTNDAGQGVTIGTFNTENPQNYTADQIAALPVSTFADAYRAMLIRLMYTYPLAEIVVILPTFTSTYYTITNLDLYVEVIKEACDFFGIKYIDARCTGINIYNRTSYLVDGIHPNVAGMDLLFQKIYRKIIFD